LSGAKAIDGLEYRMSLLSAPASQGQTGWLSQGGFQTTSGLKIDASISTV